MPRILATAADLAISPDGGWLARLDEGLLRIYDLDGTPGALAEPVMTLEQPGAAGLGNACFSSPERLLCLLPYRDADEEGQEEGITAALLDVPTLEALSRIAVPGVRRVLGMGPTGAVVAPMAAGADVITVRGTDLSLDQTFLRGDVLSATPAPERRWLFEQRGVHELWDAASRRITAHLTLSTRHPLMQVGFASGGKVIWTLAQGVPVRVEVFRFSDGRRLFDLEEPGRPLRAESQGGRLVIALGAEGGAARFLDLDLQEQSLRRLEAPPGALLAFAVRPSPTPEIITLCALREDDEPVLGRTPLERSAAAAEAPPEPPRARPQSPFLTRGEAPAPVERREPRPVSRARVQRLRREAEQGGWPERRGRFAQPNPAEEEGPPETRESEGPAESAVEPEPRLGLGRLLRRASDSGQGPGTWHWELLRWAQLLYAGGPEDVAASPPSGGPLAALGARLSLSPLGQKVLGLLYALEHLAGSHPRGLSPLEIAQLLGLIHDEAQVLGEVLPDATLRRLGLLRAGRDGRLRIDRAAAALLGGAALPGLRPAGPARPGAPRLEPGLYQVPQHAAPALAALCASLPLPVLRHDLLGEARPVETIARALRQAQLHGAAVLLDGVPSVAFPVFSTDARLAALRRLLLQPAVPLLICGGAAALGGLGLPARLLPTPAPPLEAQPPLLPSAPLPAGTFWRAPRPPARAAFLDGTAAVPGRLEPLSPGEARATILLGPTATPDDYGRAAALGARDGAVLALDTALTAARAAVLAAILRQVPVVALIPPPEGGLPPELARLLE